MTHFPDYATILPFSREGNAVFPSEDRERKLTMCKPIDENATLETLAAELFHLNETRKALDKKEKALKEVILGKIDTGKTLAGSVELNLVEKTRKTLDKGLIEEVLGVSVTDECYKVSNYKQLLVSKA